MKNKQVGIIGGTNNTLEKVIADIIAANIKPSDPFNCTCAYPDPTKATDINIQLNENINRIEYGNYNGYSQWDLAKSFLTMNNDDFFRLYGFNFIPSDELREKARKYL